MLTLIAAAALAAQAAPAADPPAGHAQMTHEQHEGMKKKDCCKDCCKDMGKGEHDMHAPGARPQRGE